MVGELEKLAFARLTGHLGIKDFFLYTSQLFSWDNRRQVGVRKLKRLDRYYCFPSTVDDPASHVLKYEINGDYSIFDHLSVFFIVHSRQL
jgi:hypothetical protein